MCVCVCVCIRVFVYVFIYNVWRSLYAIVYESMSVIAYVVVCVRICVFECECV